MFVTKRAIGRALLVILTMQTASCDRKIEPPTTQPASVDGWREFTGSWNAAGTRQSIPLGASRKASIIDLSGTLLLAGAESPGVGFRAEVIGMVDSETGLVGRSVWTDERGDQVFSEIKGQGTADGNRIAGTILGGTGRYAEVVGSYEFSWQFVIELEDGTIQGRAVGLQGRFRSGKSAAGEVKP